MLRRRSLWRRRLPLRRPGRRSLRDRGRFLPRGLPGRDAAELPADGPDHHPQQCPRTHAGHGASGASTRSPSTPHRTPLAPRRHAGPRELAAGLFARVQCNFGLSEVYDPGLCVECDAGRFHIHEDHFLAEIRDHELVLTTLCREALPLLRYRTRVRCEMTRESAPAAGSEPSSCRARDWTIACVSTKPRSMSARSRTCSPAPRPPAAPSPSPCRSGTSWSDRNIG